MDRMTSRDSFWTLWWWDLINSTLRSGSESLGVEPLPEMIWLLNCFYFPLVYHQDISPFYGDFLKRSQSHFRKLSSCWMTMIASFSGWQAEETAVRFRQKEGARTLSWPRPEGKSSLRWWHRDCGKMSPWKWQLGKVPPRPCESSTGGRKHHLWPALGL